MWAALLCCSVLSPSHAAEHTIDLSGDWAFQLDEKKVGQRERWFESDLKQSITLPGSTDEAGFGAKSEPDPVRLTREHRYVGPAWYQKTVELPESWQGKKVERVEAHPDIDRKVTQVTAWVRSRVGAVSGQLEVSAACGDHSMKTVTAKFRTKGDEERSAQDSLAPTLSDLSGPYYERRALTRVNLILPFGAGANLDVLIEQ
ncbi:MAG: hypothetical protein GY878_05585 [Fuerstiella sp.]|nr:hypothetical protein [Fuerstiella sp.]